MSIFKTIKDGIYNRLTGIERIEHKLDDILNLICVTHDVAKVPSAHGALRISQIANAALLKKVCDVLSQKRIPYWIDFGTLLGAVRHKGCIPWDDDIDIGVLRDDYNTLEAILLGAFSSEGNIIVVQSDAMRVMMKDAPCQIDIFPYDVYQVPDCEECSQRSVLSAREKACKLFKYDYKFLRSQERTITNLTNEDIKRLTKDLVASFTGNSKLLAVGPEAPFLKNHTLGYDWIFPLKEMTFEGYKFNAPQREDLVLMAAYGDYLSLPTMVKRHSDILERMSVECYEALRKRYGTLTN